MAKAKDKAKGKAPEELTEINLPATLPITQDVPQESEAPTETWDRAEAIKLRLKGYTYRDIAKLFGLKAHGTIISGLKPFKALFDAVENPELIEAFRRNKSKILTAAQMTLVMDLFDHDKREKASLNNTAYAFDKLNNAIRLEDGEATEIVDLNALINDAQAMEDALKELNHEDIIDVETDDEEA